MKNWCFFIYSGDRQLKLDFLSFVDILARRIRKCGLCTDTYLCQMCPVLRKTPTDGWYISGYKWKRCQIVWQSLLLKDMFWILTLSPTIEAMFNNACDLECCSVLMLRVVTYVRHTGTLPIFIHVLHSQAIQIQIKKTETSLTFLQIHTRNLEAATKSSHSFNEKEREFINVIKTYKTKWDAH